MSSRRLAALTAAAVLVFGACSSAATAAPTAAPATTAPSSSAASAAPASAASAAPASAAAGGAPLAGKRWCISTPGQIGALDQMLNNIVAAAAASKNGMQVTFTDGNFDTSKQLADVAQFVASGDCAAIGTITSLSADTAGAWQKTADDAKAKGIVYVNFSADWVTDAAQNFGNPHYPAGNLVGVLAGKWYSTTAGGKGSIGVLTAPQSPGLMMRVKGFEDGFKSIVPAATFNEVADPTGGVTDTAAATASLIQAHPDLNVMFGWGGDSWQGMTQAAKEAGKTTSNFYVTADDLPDPAINLFANGTNDLLQSGTEFDYSLAGVGWERSVEWALLGATIPPFGYVDPIVITKANAADIVAADTDPLNAKYTHFYNEILYYFNTAVKTGDPFLPEAQGTHWPGVTEVPKAGTTP